MKKPTEIERYAAAITDAILSLFKDEEDGGNSVYHFKLDEIDATKFFTGMVVGCCYVFNKLTGDNKSYLEFTHICNHLIVQELIKKEPNTC